MKTTNMTKLLKLVLLACSLAIAACAAASPGNVEIRLIKSVDELADAAARVALSPTQTRVSEEAIQKIFENEAKKLSMQATSMRVERVATSNANLLNGMWSILHSCSLSYLR
jgi:hypothetical protein